MCWIMTNVTLTFFGGTMKFGMVVSWDFCNRHGFTQLRASFDDPLCRRVRCLCGAPCATLSNRTTIRQVRSEKWRERKTQNKNKFTDANDLIQIMRPDRLINIFFNRIRLAFRNQVYRTRCTHSLQCIGTIVSNWMWNVILIPTARHKQRRTFLWMKNDFSVSK